ncbi:hypothetical protein BDV97DRAFT_224840 [Delphinella strobiligena]|nr:hypothetical protein BDV97DRAFT_224840 [Delphinella strobiligena]
MAKGSRSSARKFNNSKLKAKVFGPVENARTERLSAKLLELASQPKPARPEMEVEDTKTAASEAKDIPSAKDTEMEVDGTNQPRTSWIKEGKRAKEEKVSRIAKKRSGTRKAHNKIAFTKNRVAKKSSRT